MTPPSLNILHTEASLGWGGQEIRIFREAQTMRELGHQLFFACSSQSRLFNRAEEAGFTCIDIDFTYKNAIRAVNQLRHFIKKQAINLINTHSSKDAWLAGVAAKSMGIPILRTRHLSSKIKPGLNSKILYNTLSDITVCTCSAIVPTIISQAGLEKDRCLSIPTGINEDDLGLAHSQREHFRTKYQIQSDEIVVGTACVLRSWKGIETLMQAAHQLKKQPKLKWMVIGGGSGFAHYEKYWKDLDGGSQLILTNHQDPIFPALAALDVFCLLSTANEGVSQASLQAAFLKKPLITTRTGGLPEVSIPGKTGYLVDNHSPEQVSEALLRLLEDPSQRLLYGEEAQKLVLEKFTWKKTIQQMLKQYEKLLKKVDPNGSTHRA